MMHIRCMEKNQASTAKVYRVKIVKANHKRELIKGTETSYPDKIYIKANFDLYSHSGMLNCLNQILDQGFHITREWSKGKFSWIKLMGSQDCLFW